MLELDTLIVLYLLYSPLLSAIRLSITGIEAIIALLVGLIMLLRKR